MIHFNGPALAAEALNRAQQADSPTMDTESSEHLRQTAQTYATLALTAAVLNAGWQHVGEEETVEWVTALQIKQGQGGAA